MMLPMRLLDAVTPFLSRTAFGNQPPMLPKNSAHTVDANLQKHNPHDRTCEMRAVRMPARRDDVSPQLAALRLAPRVTPLVDRHRETQRSSEQVQQDLLAGIHTTTPLDLISFVFPYYPAMGTEATYLRGSTYRQQIACASSSISAASATEVPQR